MKTTGVLFFTVISIVAGAQTPSRLPDLDFEEGLRGWHKTGSAFATQPVPASPFTVDRAQVISVGGDYWHGLQFPVGSHGKWLIFTLESPGGDDATGTLISDDFTLALGQRFFRVLVGGTHDPEKERIELQVFAGSSDSGVKRDGEYSILFCVTGHDSELLRQEVFEIPTAAVGRRMRIKIADESRQGHINIDDIQFTSERPEPFSAPAWGLADYHTHPMNFMAFGAFKGIRTLWGVPGGSYSDYIKDPSAIEKDLPRCSTGHGGGPTAEAFINSVDDRQIKRPRNNLTIAKELLAGDFTNHGRRGPPTFNDFPSFLSGAHQQMHITQIHRAWQGGLRLMTVFAVNNPGVEYLVSRVKDDTISITNERDIIEAQACGIRKLASLNSEWMEVAFSPEDARRIIRDNKLAIVLGVEVDRLGQLEKGDAAHEVDYLWNLGVRHVFPIHAFNNGLGGAAVFEDAYNTTNDLMNRSPRDITPGGLKKGLKFFEVKEGCPPSTAWGECAEYQLHNPVDRVVIQRLLPDFFLDRFLPKILWQKIPFIQSVDLREYHKVTTGHMNRLGLLPAGVTYVQALAKKGMLIDLAHMSEQSVSDTYRAADGYFHAGCEDESKGREPARCIEDYPFTTSHIHFREQSLRIGETTVEGFLSSEYEISNRQLDALRHSGGVLGAFVTEDPLRPRSDQPTTPFLNDCAGSSKGFGYSVLYALSRMGGHGVGIATDYTFIPFAAPRFGPKACWPYQRADDPDKERKMNASMYGIRDQQDAVRYRDGNHPPALGVRFGNDDGLTQYAISEHRFDYNTEGFANYGMLPDFLQDLKNIGLPNQAFSSLFSSSEDYLRMWEKAWRVAGVNRATMFTLTEPVDCGVACNGLCPGPPKNGAPRRK